MTQDGNIPSFLFNWSVGGVLVVFLFLVALIFAYLKFHKLVVHPLLQLFEDWFGRPARPGKDAEPGVMERLKYSGDSLDDIQVNLKALHAKDSDLDIDLAHLKDEVGVLRTRLDGVLADIDKIHKKLGHPPEDGEEPSNVRTIA